MSTLEGDIRDLLRRAHWQDAKRVDLVADFSSRKFSRLTSNDGARTSILMETGKDDKTDKFISIAKLLKNLEISTPEIYAVNATGSLVLMEDFGDKNCGRAVDAGCDAKNYYRLAVDMLIHLHQHLKTVAGLPNAYPVFDKDLFTQQALLFLDVYLPFVRDGEALKEKARVAFAAACREMLSVIDGLPQSFILRDFMLDNLMELKDRAGWRGLGVLDFQDGGVGPIAYDLVSLLEVARREGGDLYWNELIHYYCMKAKPQCDLIVFERSCTVLSLQRHLRILGLIANYTQRTKRLDKLAYLPRIKKHISRLLQNDAATPMRLWFEANDQNEVRLV